MGQEKYLKFDQESLISEFSKGGETGIGVCLGYCIQFIKYFKKYGTSDSIAKGFGSTEGSGLKESLLDTGEKSVATHHERSGSIDYTTLFGKKNELVKMGFTLVVGNSSGADKNKTVAEIKSSSRFAFHIIYFNVTKPVTGWHVVVLKGNGWEGLGFERIFYAMDPNQGLWRISGTQSLGDWLSNDIIKHYGSYSMIVYTIT